MGIDPVIKDKLLDLLVNFVSFLLAGGLITLFIEWRRHQREAKTWAREDRLLEIELPKADMFATKWAVEPKMTAAHKLQIYENKLEGTWRYALIVGTFVIRNTTNSEIVVVDYDAEAVGFTTEEKRFYDLETADLISVKEVGAVKLRPLSVIARQVILETSIDLNNRIETLPTTLSVRAITSSGDTIQQSTTLKLIPYIPPEVELHKFSYHPKMYVAKLKLVAEAEPADETEIPF